MINVSSRIALLVGITALVMLAPVARAVVLFEDDFTELPTITMEKSGFTWIGYGLNTDPYVSEPSSLALAASFGRTETSRTFL